MIGISLNAFQKRSILLTAEFTPLLIFVKTVDSGIFLIASATLLMKSANFSITPRYVLEILSPTAVNLLTVSNAPFEPVIADITLPIKPNTASKTRSTGIISLATPLIAVPKAPNTVFIAVKAIVNDVLIVFTASSLTINCSVNFLKLSVKLNSFCESRTPNTSLKASPIGLITELKAENTFLRPAIMFSLPPRLFIFLANSSALIVPFLSSSLSFFICSTSEALIPNSSISASLIEDNILV